MLPCQHSFCRCCLERLAENDGRWGRCPQCRQLFRIPFNGVASFDVNRTIAQLLETIPKQSNERPVLRAKCASCRREEIITTCEHCKEALCKQCRVGHFEQVKGDLGKKILKIETESDKFLVKEVESLSKHESNLSKCKEIRILIQKKVGDIIQRIKDEESKLLDEVEDFERAETSFLSDKANRLKELENMSRFGTLSNKALIGSVFKLNKKKNFVKIFIFVFKEKKKLMEKL